jgi:hypothetical protein
MSTTNFGNTNGEEECRQVRCSFEQESVLSGNAPADFNGATQMLQAGEGAIDNPAHGQQSAFTADHTTPGVMLTHHHHLEHNKNHRCRHNLHTGICTCFCHDKNTRETAVGFKRTMLEIRSDYAGLDGATQRDLTNKLHDYHETFDEDRLHSQKHDWVEATMSTTEYDNSFVHNPHWNE